MFLKVCYLMPNWLHLFFGFFYVMHSKKLSYINVKIFFYLRNWIKMYIIKGASRNKIPKQNTDFFVKYLEIYYAICWPKLLKMKKKGYDMSNIKKNGGI